MGRPFVSYLACKGSFFSLYGEIELIAFIFERNHSVYFLKLDKVIWENSMIPILKIRST